jgi:predicted secreted protein
MARAGLIAIAALLSVSGATAAERAEFDLIGYSPDGRYFAFEQYGVQDGSGFAYSDFFVIDLDRDAWAAGPFHEQAGDEATALAAVRADARQAAQPALDGFDISVPAVEIALNGDGEPGIDGLTLDFGVPGYSDPGHMFASYALALTIYEAPTAQDCIVYLGEPAKGFGLDLISDGDSQSIHHDLSIPASRGCPTTYRITAVVLPFGAYDISRAVALISVYAFGFEGVDRRFVALPLVPPGP